MVGERWGTSGWGGVQYGSSGKVRTYTSSGEDMNRLQPPFVLK